MRSKLSGHVPETALDQYAEVVALDAFSAGFKAAMELLADISEEDRREKSGDGGETV